METIKVLIVDDEMIVRIGIRNIIDWKHYGFEIAGEAANGQEALALVDTLCPDIVLSDIKMPKMDGLELLKELRKKGDAAPVFIVLSCYSDFDLVKEALISGASDYILKLSMQSNNLLETMLNIKKRLQLSPREKDSPPITNPSTAWGKVIKEYLSEEGGSEKAAPDNHSFMCLLSVTNIYRLHTGGLTKTEKRRLLDLSVNFFNDYQNYHGYNYGIAPNTVITVLRCEKELDSVDYQTQLQRLSHLHKLIETHLNCIAVSAIAENAVPLPETRDTLNQLLFTAGRGFYHISSHIYTGQSNPYCRASSDYMTNTELHRLYKNYSTGLVDLAEGQVDNLIEQLYTNKDLPPEAAIALTRSILNMFYYSTWTDAKEAGPFSDSQMSFDFGQVLHLDQIEEAFRSFFSQYHRYSEDSLHPSYYDSLLMTRQYVKDHFQEKITLDDIAAYTRLSKNYFCTVFRQEFGETFTEFLISVRMDHAKKLLSTTNLSIAEVSVQCGYESSNYFSTLFHKVAGLSPQQFRHYAQKGKGRIAPEP